METENSEGEIDVVLIANEILATHPTKKTLINALHSVLLQFEDHLDSVIKRYKIMSITLLAATGAAIGFSFSGELKDVQVNKLIMASTVCIFGMIGLASIWYLDIQVFHKFWGSFFVEEVKMEERHPFLVDIGDIAVSIENIKLRLIGDGNWYIFFNVILITAAAGIFSFVWASAWIKILIFFIAFCAAITIARLMTNASHKLLRVVEKMLNLVES